MSSAQVLQLMSEPQCKTPRPSKTDSMQMGQKTHVSENILVKIKKCGGDCANDLLEKNRPTRCCQPVIPSTCQNYVFTLILEMKLKYAWFLLFVMQKKKI